MNIRLKYRDRLLAWITSAISLISFLYYYFHAQQNLADYDAVARLDTARKMIDSITPGIGQLGGLWLPFPQILMLPFVWNDFLWHSGIAGYIVSGTAFVVGAVFLQKAVYALTQQRKIALTIWFLFVSNVNILLLQTMAMSEAFFLCFFIVTLYYLIRWSKEHKLVDFMLIAACLMVLTLTRYEGDFIFVGVFLAVVVECFRYYTIRSREKIEGMLLIFLTVAGFGILLWCIYSALFYKDPLFWLHSYGPPQTSVIQGKPVIEKVYEIQNPTVLQSLEIYGSVMAWTNGIFVVVLGALGMVLSLFRPKRIVVSLWIVTTVLLVFLIFGYYKGLIPHIEFPTVLLTGDGVRDWSVYADNNVRYGMVIFPCLLFFAALAAAKKKIFFIIVALFAFEQSFFAFVSPQLFQYPFYKSWKYPSNVAVPWFRAHYTGGLVLIAASRHEDFMFQSKLPYKDFIYEGTRSYWYESLNHPSTYATWVIYDDTTLGDDVTLGITAQGLDDLKKHFHLVYQHNGLHIYALKNI